MKIGLMAKFGQKQQEFHWRGRTPEGVSKWTGSPEPLKWMGRVFTVYGGIAGAGGVTALLYGLITHHFKGAVLPLTAVGLSHGIVFTSIGVWALAMRRHILRLVPAEDVSASLGIDPPTLNALAEQRNIKPCIILNDQPYYDPSAFADGRNLLRASSARQVGTDMLLQPVTGKMNSSSAELLRHYSGTQEPKEPATEEIQVNIQNIRS